MRLLCFQAKRFRWKSYLKSLSDVADQEVEEDVRETLVVFFQVERTDGENGRAGSIRRQTVKHIKWLANKRELRNIVLHSFTHLGGTTATPACGESFIAELAGRLRETGYSVWTTPFGYLCEWDLSVYGESLAKVWREIQ